MTETIVFTIVMVKPNEICLLEIKIALVAAAAAAAADLRMFTVLSLWEFVQFSWWMQNSTSNRGHKTTWIGSCHFPGWLNPGDWFM